MAAGIEKDDSLMYVGEVPWHSLGTKLPRTATAEEAIQAAGLNWTVRKEQIKSSTSQKDCEGWFLTVREDTGTPLGCMGSWYRVLQNRDAFQFFDAVTKDPGGPKYVTAGSLHNGRIIWILVKLPSFISVVKEDIVEEYILLTHGHDGLHTIEMKWTPVRVVCQNTLAISLGSKGVGIKFKHLGPISARIGSAQEALGIAAENHMMLGEVVKSMVTTSPTDEQIETVLATLFPAQGERVSTRTTNTREKVLELVEKGRGNELKGVVGSWWALYNAVTEYSDYYKPVISRRGDKADARLNSVWFGSARQLKEQAFDLVTAEMAKG